MSKIYFTSQNINTIVSTLTSKTQESPEKKKEGASLSQNQMMGLTALGAIVLGGIYYVATKGKNSSKLTNALSNSEPPEIKSEMKMTKRSEEIFTNIESQLNGKRKININENKSETLQKMEDFSITI